MIQTNEYFVRKLGTTRTSYDQNGDIHEEGMLEWGKIMRGSEEERAEAFVEGDWTYGTLHHQRGYQVEIAKSG